MIVEVDRLHRNCGMKKARRDDAPAGLRGSGSQPGARRYWSQRDRRQSGWRGGWIGGPSGVMRGSIAGDGVW